MLTMLCTSLYALLQSILFLPAGYECDIALLRYKPVTVVVPKIYKYGTAEVKHKTFYV
jgi:hypothetical protein